MMQLIVTRMLPSSCSPGDLEMPVLEGAADSPIAVADVSWPLRPGRVVTVPVDADSTGVTDTVPVVEVVAVAEAEANSEEDVEGDGGATLLAKPISWVSFVQSNHQRSRSLTDLRLVSIKDRIYVLEEDIAQ